NNGNGTFTDVSKEAGLNVAARGMATAWADYDNDGWIDCLITTYGENLLFRNNGDGTFTDVSKEAGMSGIHGFWAGASWGDYNLDGHLDLYITGYVEYFEIPVTDEIANLQEPPSINPSVFEPHQNLLYKNNGDGTFTETAAASGVANPGGRSLQSIWIDITLNGYPDLYVANDVSDNMLYRNMGDGTFMNISHPAKVADYRGSMGIAAGDWDGDGDMDLFITHWIAQENALYNNLQNEESTSGMIFFRDDADRLGLGQSSLSYVGWATFFFDFDNDGRPDLFVSNGHTNQRQDQPTALVGMNDQLYWNRNNEEGFYEISSIAGDYFSKKLVGRGGAYADYNNNGNLDLVINNHNGPAVLLENQTETDYNWFQVSLEGTASNRSAIGARMRLITSAGIQIREVGSQRSYLSQNSLVQHFGLKNETSVDTLEIIWPGGGKQSFENLPVNQRIHIVKGHKDFIPM
ncbi:MAG: CRTAC1 family protein, partial [Balneolaceae bacterium]